jgi:hypothetical protein
MDNNDNGSPFNSLNALLKKNIKSPVIPVDVDE